MNSFFSTEGRYYKIATEFGYIIMLGALWLVTSLPIITIGASTTAAYYVATKRRSGVDEYLFSSFFKSFAENFVAATSIFVILAIFGFLLYANSIILLDGTGGMLSIIFSVILLFVAIQWTFVTVFVFAILARFQVSFLQAIKTSFFMSNRHFKQTIYSIAIFILIVGIGIIANFVLPFAMGAYIYFTAGIFIKVFRIHSPDIDKNKSDKDIREAAELEEVRDFGKINSNRQ